MFLCNQDEINIILRSTHMKSSKKEIARSQQSVYVSLCCSKNLVSIIILRIECGQAMSASSVSVSSQIITIINNTYLSDYFLLFSTQLLYTSRPVHFLKNSNARCVSDNNQVTDPFSLIRTR